MKTERITLFNFLGHEIILEKIQAIGPLTYLYGIPPNKPAIGLNVLFFGESDYKTIRIELLNDEFNSDPDGIDRWFLYNKDGELNGNLQLSETKAAERIMPVYNQLLHQVKTVT